MPATATKPHLAAQDNLTPRVPTCLTIRTFAAGQVLWREGDALGPLYVICSGVVRAYKKSASKRDSIEELALLGPGEIVGELAPVLRQTRSATVEALEPTQAIEIPPERVPTVVGRHLGLRRVLALALKHRAHLTEAEISRMAERAGLHLPPDVFATEALPVPPHDPRIAYPKALTCPACGTRFSTLVIQPRKVQPVERSSDFHQRYRTPFNPYDYELWVCPKDLYAALPSDFADLSDTDRPKVSGVVSAVVDRWEHQCPDFNGDRDLTLREHGLELALALYQMRKLPPLRQAAILHRLAWCARERCADDVERAWLWQALEAYSQGYSEADLPRPRDELKLQYLCGELSARLGDAHTALRWFGQALRHPALKKHPNWERMIRERWGEVRSEHSPGAPAATT